jgi:hypothetical protein
MKTEQLITLLATNAGPAPRHAVARRLLPAALLGLLASAALALAVFGLIPPALFHTAVPWTKLAYAGALALGAAWLAAQLARPAAPTRAARRATAAVVAAMALLGAASLGWEASGTRLQAWLGHSWFSCPLSLMALSLPALAATLWALRGLAPTQLRQAGFAAGLLAGAVGAGGYALSCPEASPAFVATWYSLGIGLCGGLGALLGPRVLRW